RDPGRRLAGEEKRGSERDAEHGPKIPPGECLANLQRRLTAGINHAGHRTLSADDLRRVSHAEERTPITRVEKALHRAGETSVTPGHPRSAGPRDRRWRCHSWRRSSSPSSCSRWCSRGADHAKSPRPAGLADRAGERPEVAALARGGQGDRKPPPRGGFF